LVGAAGPAGEAAWHALSAWRALVRGRVWALPDASCAAALCAELAAPVAAHVSLGPRFEADCEDVRAARALRAGAARSVRADRERGGRTAGGGPAARRGDQLEMGAMDRDDPAARAADDGGVRASAGWPRVSRVLPPARVSELAASACPDDAWVDAL